MKYEITYFPKQIISEKIYDLLISEGIEFECDELVEWVTNVAKITLTPMGYMR